MPLVRLSAFFVAVVVAGNLLLHAFYQPPSGASEDDSAREYFSHKKRQLHRHYRKVERFFNVLNPEPSGDPTSAPACGDPPVAVIQKAEACSGEPEMEQVEETLEIARVESDPSPVLQPAGLRLEEPKAILAPVPQMAAMTWMEPPALPLRTVDLSLESSGYDVSVLTPEVLTEWAERGESDSWIEVGDSLLKGPEYLFDGVLALADGLSPRRRVHVWTREGDEEGLVDRLFDFTIEPRQGHIFSEFMGHVAHQEYKYFSKFGESDLNTSSFQDGESDIDVDELASDQGKVLWDAFRKTYFSKYKFRAEETIRDDAFHLRQWRGVDFVLLPPLMGGYLYYRGLEKKFKIAGTRLRVALEPVSDWIREDNITTGLGLHWTPSKHLPVGLIVSAGLYDGDVELDFIGIGTSIGMAKRVLRTQQGE